MRRIRVLPGLSPHWRRGIATVEFAVMMPLLLFVLVVAIDFSRVYSYSQALTDCARNGAVFLSDPDRADQSGFDSIEEAALAGVGNIKPAPSVTSDFGEDLVGNPYASVTVTYTFRPMTRLPLMPAEYKLQRTAAMYLTDAAQEE
jgi:Flp pilus assembly protein TadG